MAIKEGKLLVKAGDAHAAQKARQTPHTNEEELAQTFPYEPAPARPFMKGELFRFDPNTLSPEGRQKPGLSERTARTIQNYRNKSGKFYKAEDIQKICGLPKGFFERVEAYITIAPLAPLPAFNSKPVYEKEERKPKS